MAEFSSSVTSTSNRLPISNARSMPVSPSQYPSGAANSRASASCRKAASFFQAAFKREELYHCPHFEQAADLILAPYDGYDPKGTLYKETLSYKGDELVGMHTFDDAMLYLGGRTVPQTRFSVLAVMPTILDLMGVPHPPDLDGESLV